MKKNILIVSSLQIFPPQLGGQIRTADLCRSLFESGWNVNLYSFTGRKVSYLKGVSSFTSEVNEYIHEHVSLNIFWGFLQFFSYRFGLPPIWSHLLSRLYAPKKLEELMEGADYMIVDFPYLSPYLSKFKGIKILNTHNAEFLLWRHRPIVSKFVNIIEKNAFRVSDYIFFCGSQDVDSFADQLSSLKEKIYILPHSYKHCQPQNHRRIRNKIRSKLKISVDDFVIVFCGSLFGPNWECLEFLKEFYVQNEIVLSDLKITFLIVGSVDIRNLTKNRFKIIGATKNIRLFLGAGDIGINPVKQGSGVNIKVFDYVSAGLPVLTTHFGSRGLPLSDGNNCFFFERDSLLDEIIKIKNLSQLELQELSSNAQKDFAREFNMKKNLNNFFINQVRGGHARKLLSVE